MKFDERIGKMILGGIRNGLSRSEVCSNLGIEESILTEWIEEGGKAKARKNALRKFVIDYKKAYNESQSSLLKLLREGDQEIKVVEKPGQQATVTKTRKKSWRQAAQLLKDRQGEDDSSGFVYYDFKTDLHNMRDDNGRRFSIKELAHLAGVKPGMIYATLKEPDCPKNSVSDFIVWRINKFHPTKIVTSKNQELEDAKLRKEKALAEKREFEASVGELEVEKKRLENKRLELRAETMETDLQKRKRENLIDSKLYVNRQQAQLALDEALIRFKITLENFSNNFSDRWASISNPSDIREEIDTEIRRLLTELSETDISSSAEERMEAQDAPALPQDAGKAPSLDS